ncbi:hypothetical protein BD410DRAFT_797563 [Rickenella mellea]|uniref:Uncharacterized protein n=1 Tax=Rickenella mellea TaxID=50990 RepID=A0A4Y7PE54_9AGAM|nr:hypothetical protein BD410DRAFT_797563 [Rickenella mellea]
MPGAPTTFGMSSVPCLCLLCVNDVCPRCHHWYADFTPFTRLFTKPRFLRFCVSAPMLGYSRDGGTTISHSRKRHVELMGNHLLFSRFSVNFDSFNFPRS